MHNRKKTTRSDNISALEVLTRLTGLGSFEHSLHNADVCEVTGSMQCMYIKVYSYADNLQAALLTFFLTVSSGSWRILRHPRAWHHQLAEALMMTLHPQKKGRDRNNGW